MEKTYLDHSITIRVFTTAWYLNLDSPENLVRRPDRLVRLDSEPDVKVDQTVSDCSFPACLVQLVGVDVLDRSEWDEGVILELLEVHRGEPARAPLEIVGVVVGSIAIEVDDRTEGLESGLGYVRLGHELGDRGLVLDAIAHEAHVLDASLVHAQTHEPIGVVVPDMAGVQHRVAGEVRYLSPVVVQERHSHFLWCREAQWGKMSLLGGFVYLVLF